MRGTLRKKGWLAVVIFSLLGQIAWTMENMLLNSFISNMFFASLSDIAAMVSLSAVVATLTTLFTGALSDKVGKRKIFICGGYIAWGISIVAFCFLKVDWLKSVFPYANAFSLGISLTILFDCIMTFFGSAANDAGFNAYLTDVSDDTNRGKVEGVNSSMPLISVLIVFGLFGGVTSTNNWDALFIAIGAIVLIGGLLGLYLIDDSPDLRPKKDNYLKNIFYGFRVKSAKENPALYTLLAIFCVFSIAIQVYMPYLIIYFTKTLALDNYVFVFAPAIIIAAAFTILFGRIFDRKGLMKVIFWTLGVFSLGLIVLFIAKATVWVFIGCLLMMIGWLTSAAGINASIRRYTPKSDVGLFQGIRILTAVLIPMLIGPWIGSFVSGSAALAGGTVGSDYIPSNRIFIAAFIVNIATFVLLLLLKRFIFSKRAKLTSKYENDDELKLNIYPRSSLKRRSFLNLNTQWDFAVSLFDKIPEVFPLKIQVPYAPESIASGLAMTINDADYMFYKTTFKFNIAQRKEVTLLHFEGVDNYAEVYLNGKKIGEHTGGYLPFEFEIQDYLKPRAENVLIVKAKDDNDRRYPYGKQSKKSRGMWYTKVSGIYKPVWIETVAKERIEKVRFAVDLKERTVTVNSEGTIDDKLIIVDDGIKEVYRKMYKGNSHTFRLDNMALWSSESPRVYNVKIKTKSDEIETYFACRDVCLKNTSVYLNGAKVFINGLLYQPYFSGGLLTPESYRAYYDDVKFAKNCGFNALRVHVALPLEPFYEICDRLGMMVIQDAVNNYPYSYVKDTVIPYLFKGYKKDNRDKDPIAQGIFIQTAVETVKRLDFYPCIIMWTIFNEGWGQFSSAENYRLFRQLDPTRLIDVNSGWVDVGVNPFDSRHLYFHPLKMNLKDRPYFISECGGFSYAVANHAYNPHNSYGYKFYSDEREYAKGLISFYTNEVAPLAKKGLCGVIYTELNDVEDETNGLLTFDRRVAKINPRVLYPIVHRISAES